MLGRAETRSILVKRDSILSAFVPFDIGAHRLGRPGKQGVRCAPDNDLGPAADHADTGDALDNRELRNLVHPQISTVSHAGLTAVSARGFTG